jgi:S1-C subfamily serine protease
LAFLQDEILTSAVGKASPSVVNIGTKNLRWNSYMRGRPVDGMGSGLILSQDGYIVTNNHVVAGAREIRVSISDGRRLIGETVGTDAGNDLALLKVQARSLPESALGDSDRLKVGQIAIAIGNPFGFLLEGPTVTVGVVSALHRTIDEKHMVLEDLIQTDAAINPGNSGGPLVDSQGRAIGINNAVLPFAQGIGFAIPINTVKRVVFELINYGKVMRGWLGVSALTMTEEVAEEFDMPLLKGVLVVGITPGSPAQKCGLRERDLITSIGGDNTPTTDDLKRILQNSKPGAGVVVKFLRKGRPCSLEAVLEDTPAP